MVTPARQSSAGPYQSGQTGDRDKGHYHSGNEQYPGLRSAAFGKGRGNCPSTGSFNDIGARDYGGNALAFLDLGVQR